MLDKHKQAFVELAAWCEKYSALIRAHRSPTGDLCFQFFGEPGDVFVYGTFEFHSKSFELARHSSTWHAFRERPETLAVVPFASLFKSLKKEEAE